MDTEVASLKTENARLEADLKAERLARTEAEKAIDAKISTIAELTKKLSVVEKGLEEARVVGDQWKKASERMTELVAQLRNAHMTGDMVSLKDQLEKLATEKKTLDTQLSTLGEEASALRETGTAWGGMLSQLQTTFQGLTTDYATKKQLLEEAEKNISTLKAENSKLTTARQDLSAEANRAAEENAKLAAQKEREIEVTKRLVSLFETNGISREEIGAFKIWLKEKKAHSAV
jgi:chromosome segregation ATPase